MENFNIVWISNSCFVPLNLISYVNFFIYYNFLFNIYLLLLLLYSIGLF